MANALQLTLLQQDVICWNEWRHHNSGVSPDLSAGDLAGLNISGAILVSADLSGATLTRAVLTNADLTRADLTQASLNGADLEGARLTAADLREAILVNANVAGVDLRSVRNITQAQLDAALGDEGTTLPPNLSVPQHWQSFVAALKSGADRANDWRKRRNGINPILADLSFRGYELRSLNLSGCVLKRCNFTAGDLSTSGFSQSTLSDVVFYSAQLTDANFHSAALPNTDLRSAVLVGAIFRQADLTNSLFSLANLDAAILENANLSGADLRLAANLTQKQINSAIGDESTMLPTTLSRPIHWRRFANVIPLGAPAISAWRSRHKTPPNISGYSLRGANLEAMDLSSVNLETCDLTNANLAKSILVGSKLAKATCDGASFEGARLTGARLHGALLTNSVGLLQDQVDVAEGDSDTRLPPMLSMPFHWCHAYTKRKSNMQREHGRPQRPLSASMADLDLTEYYWRRAARSLFPKIRDRSVDSLATFWEQHYGTLPPEMVLLPDNQRRSSNIDFRAAEALKLLMETGFIQIHRPTGELVNDFDEVFGVKSSDFSMWKIEPTAQWKNIVRAYGFGVDVLSLLNEENTYIVQPMFKGVSVDGRVDVFVAMPFSPAFSRVYDVAKLAGERCGKVVRRGDDIGTSSGANIVMNQVWDMIKRCDMFVADCSGRNANVFYELGIAHALGKTTLILVQDKEDIPFNIKHVRYLRYDRAPEQLEQLALELERFFTGSRE